MFVLEIEYLNGISYATRISGTNQVTEWPPHPDRVFMALIDAWGETKNFKEAEALRWLEAQKPPNVLFPSANHRKSFQNFVPVSSNAEECYFNKDKKTRKLKPIYNIVSSINRKPRFFPAAILPDADHIVYLVWENAHASSDIYEAILTITKRVHRIGHSASLVRMSVMTTNETLKYSNTYVHDKKKGSVFLRCPYSGRFDELTKGFESHNTQTNDEQWRPNLAISEKYRNPDEQIIQSVMGNDWCILECKGLFTCAKKDDEKSNKKYSAMGFSPDIRAFPYIAKKIRDALMSHIIHEPIHEIISGHSHDGTMLQKPHLAILPLANIGWGKFSDSRLLGVALALPRKSTYGTTERRQLKQAISKFLENEPLKQTNNQNTENGMINASDIGVIKFSNVSHNKNSLLHDRYTNKSKYWDSVTPLVLDHYPKKNKKAEEIIMASCVNIGLPKPEFVSISRYSKVSGSPPAFISNEPRKGWRSPKKGLFDNKFVCHASLSFSCDVEGPIILGAGRYYGLGLFIKSRGDERWY